MTYPLRFRKQTLTLNPSDSFTPDAGDYGYFDIEFTGGSGDTMTINAPINAEPGQPLLFRITVTGTINTGIHGPIPWNLGTWNGPSGPWTRPKYSANEYIKYYDPTTPPGTYILDGYDWYPV
jgi:hypothetical protein